MLLWLIVGCILEKIENQFAVIASTDRAASSQAIMSGDENELDPRGGDQMWLINVYKEKVVKEECLTASTE